MRATRAARAAATIVLGVLGGLVAVELVLQAAGLVVRWSERTRLDAPAAGERVVLCVGDSFTWGMNVGRTETYPVRLQEELRAAEPGANWRVVADAGPGRSASDVLERLPAGLTQQHPAFVCILVGSTDWWREDEAAPEDWRGQAVRFLRKLRLARLVMGRGGERNAAVPAKAGPSTADSSATPAAAADWTLERLEAPPPGGVIDQRRRQAYDRLRREIAAAGDSASMIRLIRAAARDRMVRVVVQEGERWLAEREPTAEVCRHLAASMIRMRDPERSLAYARQAVSLAPEDIEGLRLLAEAEWVWGTTDAAVQTIARAYDAGASDAMMDRWFRRHVVARRYSEPQLLALLRDVPLDVEQRETLAALLRESAKSTAEEQALTERLEAIVARTREAGAEPILMTYPTPGKNAPLLANDCARDVGESRDVRVVDLARVFADSLRAVPTPDLFHADGHCNAEGYRLFARRVAATLLGRQAAGADDFSEAGSP